MSCACLNVQESKAICEEPIQRGGEEESLLCRVHDAQRLVEVLDEGARVALHGLVVDFSHGAARRGVLHELVRGGGLLGDDLVLALGAYIPHSWSKVNVLSDRIFAICC